MESLPARGAWIEITENKDNILAPCSRSPHGERGLKYSPSKVFAGIGGSLPARGAWIEIKKTL